jgi:hypothetical protein
VLGGWEGSPPGARILDDTLSRDDVLNIPHGKFYLENARYAHRPGILPPFKITKYHLNESSSRNIPHNVK